MSKKILVICPYPENEVPGQRLKYEQYFNFLTEKGYSIKVAPFFSHFFYKRIYLEGNYLIKIIGTTLGYIKRIYQILYLPFYDGIYIFLYVTPFFGFFFERIFRIVSKKIIYDIDDLVFLNRTSETNYLVKFLRKPEKFFYLMGCSNHVITCTPYLDSLVRRYNNNTTDISSTIDCKKYIPTNKYNNNHKIILGWSGSHSTLPFLRILEPTLLKLRNFFDFKLLVIGGTSFSIDGIDVTVIPWNESTEVEDLRKIDIGLYPLPDEEWVLGKSGLKALQYMALGIPTVATAIGSNFRIIEDQVSGYLVKSETEWFMILSELMKNYELRKIIGTKGREVVEKYFSVEANKFTYLKIFNNVY
jgi:glycosyltransferase involved in cell wall biosynthesis